MDTGTRVSLVSQDDAGIVSGMSYGASDGLVHCLHTEILIVNLTWQSPIRISRLRERERGGRGGGGGQWTTLHQLDGHIIG